MGIQLLLSLLQYNSLQRNENIIQLLKIIVMITFYLKPQNPLEKCCILQPKFSFILMKNKNYK